MTQKSKNAEYLVIKVKSKVSLICIALNYELLISKALTYCTCKHGITQFYLPPARLSTSGMSHTCLYCQAAELHSHLAGTYFPSHCGYEAKLAWVDHG